MRILIFSDSYPPEIRSAAILMQEFAEGMVQRGHEVCVTTLIPKYNVAGKTAASGRVFYTYCENGVNIIRINSLPVHNTKLWIRGIGELVLPIIFFASSFRAKEPDLIVSYSPPLTLGLAAAALKYLKGIPFILNVQDLFPQHIIDVGILKDHITISFFQHLESLIYSMANNITVHSEGNRQFLLKERGVSAEKVKVIHNWVDPDLPLKAESLNFRGKWGLGDKFVLFFGGVMGPTQGLEIVLEVAQRVAEVKDILFLLLGDGSERPTLERLVKERRLSNIILGPFVTSQEYWSLLNEVDVGLLTLAPEVKTPVVPSKLFGFMAASKPYIASINKESDALPITQKSAAGFAVMAGKAAEFTEAVLTLYHNRDLGKKMGNHGRTYALSHFSKEHCLAQYEEIFKRYATLS
jgi:colanic acid biosynthesis glycosyl transferase WcaI